MIFRALIACLRVVVVVAILGAIGYVIYDIMVSDQEKRPLATAPPVPMIGDMAMMTNTTVGCPAPEDVGKVKDLLSRYTDRQPAASYSVEHGCIVLSKFKSFKVQAYSAKHGTECLQVAGQQHCLWAPVEMLTKQSAPAPR
jgi:hypothetical protein